MTLLERLIFHKVRVVDTHLSRVPSAFALAVALLLSPPRSDQQKEPIQLLRLIAKCFYLHFMRDATTTTKTSLERPTSRTFSVINYERCTTRASLVWLCTVSGLWERRCCDAGTGVGMEERWCWKETVALGTKGRQCAHRKGFRGDKIFKC